MAFRVMLMQISLQGDQRLFFFPLVCVVAVQLKFQALPSSTCYLASSGLLYTLPVAITAFKLRFIIPACTDLLEICISENALPLACMGGNGEEDQNVPIQRSRHCHKVYRNMTGGWSIIYLLSCKGKYSTIILYFREISSRPNTLTIIILQH